MLKRLTNKRIVLTGLLMAGLSTSLTLGQAMPKSQMGNLIKKVEDGVDQFRDYLDKRGETGKETAAAPAAQSRTKRAQPTDAQKNNAKSKKDALDDSLGELNKSTNKLRRKFDSTDNWISTKSEVQTVVDDGRKVNTSLTKGNYGTEAAKLWGVLRSGINDLARAYGVTPLGA